MDGSHRKRRRRIVASKKRTAIICLVLSPLSLATVAVCSSTLNLRQTASAEEAVVLGLPSSESNDVGAEASGIQGSVSPLLQRYMDVSSRSQPAPRAACAGPAERSDSQSPKPAARRRANLEAATLAQPQDALGQHPESAPGEQRHPGNSTSASDLSDVPTQNVPISVPRQETPITATLRRFEVDPTRELVPLLGFLNEVERRENGKSSRRVKVPLPGERKNYIDVRQVDSDKQMEAEAGDLRDEFASASPELFSLPKSDVSEKDLRVGDTSKGDTALSLSPKLAPLGETTLESPTQPDPAISVSAASVSATSVSADAGQTDSFTTDPSVLQELNRLYDEQQQRESDAKNVEDAESISVRENDDLGRGLADSELKGIALPTSIHPSDSQDDSGLALSSPHSQTVGSGLAVAIEPPANDGQMIPDLPTPSARTANAWTMPRKTPTINHFVDQTADAPLTANVAAEQDSQPGAEQAPKRPQPLTDPPNHPGLTQHKALAVTKGFVMPSEQTASNDTHVPKQSSSNSDSQETDTQQVDASFAVRADRLTREMQHVASPSESSSPMQLSELKIKLPPPSISIAEVRAFNAAQRQGGDQRAYLATQKAGLKPSKSFSTGSSQPHRAASGTARQERKQVDVEVRNAAKPSLLERLRSLGRTKR